MSKNRITTTLAALNGTDYAPLVGKSDIFQYENGRKTSDTPIGVRLNLVLQGSRLTPLSVKFDHDPLPKLSDEQIVSSTNSCQYLYVQIPDCSVTIYSTENGMGMTATATTAKLVTINSGDK